MTDFDAILRNWQTDIESFVTDLRPSPLPLAEMTDVELLDEFCFFYVEHREAKARNSAFNERHLSTLLGEIKRRYMLS